VAYAVLLFAVLGLTPLWLDELLQLRATRGRNLLQMMQSVFTNAGAVPLPYLAQKAALDLFGFSTFIARLPAALFGILSGAVFAVLCRQLELPMPRVALLLFLFLPLQFRYGVEARGYSQGLFFCVLSLSLLLRLRSCPTTRNAFLYWLSLVLGLYSQPLTFLIAAAQGAWAWFSQTGTRLKLMAVSAIAAAGLSFVPWLLIERHVQKQLGTMDSFWFSADQISRGVILRELAGDGYLCSIPLLILAAVACWSGSLPPSSKWLLLTTAAAGLLGPILTDALFNYFFASRQFLFAMPPLVLLASVGTCDLWRKGRRVAAAALVIALAVGAAAKDYKQATQPIEDWRAAADAIALRLQPDGCFLAVPAVDLDFYTFFRTDLGSRACNPESYPAQVITATSPYARTTGQQHMLDSLLPRYAKTDESAVSRFRIAVYRLR